MVVVDPSTWISLAAVAISLVFGVLNAGHNGRSDIKDQLETAKQQASQQARIETSLSVQSEVHHVSRLIALEYPSSC